ncbi:hypothetical protein VM1G_11279 [Cytospora mali]|uniref:Uncharacterized protein n=1 Tax=Cytospora mali TaxID=578113 RepID=A0A194VL50_CYTMA|nr:hypothetical protein VM1G_11279 [Valsa mali]
MSRGTASPGEKAAAVSRQASYLRLVCEMRRTLADESTAVSDPKLVLCLRLSRVALEVAYHGRRRQFSRHVDPESCIFGVTRS